MKKPKYYVTTPIYYASGDLHVGHCFCTVITDACARFKRLSGFDVMFLTGSDEHGLKIVRNAEKAGMEPKPFVDKVVESFKYVWSRLGISYDKFIRTTDDYHVESVKKIVDKLYAQGDIYLGKYEGLYCVPCETFFMESQLVNGCCPDCGRAVEKTSEECYFFKMSKYSDYLKNLFETNNNFLVPTARKNEIYNNFVKDGVKDLCISRTTFDWGIKMPFNDKHVVYVWIDALTNYINALGYNSSDDSLMKKYWPADVHFVGRDITRFHTTIWFALLKALGVEPPKCVHSTGFVTLKGDKISKSKSNGFNPITLCDRYGADAFRFYLLKEGPIYNDVPYTAEIFIKTINSDLCNNLGNLVSRTVAMITQNFNGITPKPNELNEDDNNLIAKCNNLLIEVNELMNDQRVDLAIKKIMEVVDMANKYIDITTPWVLAKSEEGKVRLETVLYILAETIRICSVLLQFALVEIPNKIFEALGTKDELKTFDSIRKFSMENYGSRVVKGEPIFKRLDVEKEIEYLDNPDQSKTIKEENDKTTETNKEEMKKEEVKMEETNQINIEYFDKVKLVVGTIVDSENVEGSEKLLKNTVEINGEKRTIVSGIAKTYKPNDIIGRQVVVVENLKPIKLKGILSSGMILCAVDEKTNKLCLVSPIEGMPQGTIVC